MKKFLTYGLISIVFFACNVKKDVVRVVVINANTQNKYYYHKISDADNGTNRIPDSAKIAREGTNIDIRVTGFNPLTQTVSVNPVQTNYFYSTQSTLLTSFFPATPAVPASAEKSTDKAIISPPTIEALRFTGIKKLNQKTYCLINDPLYLSVKEYLAFKKKVDSTYKNNFNCFYREIIYFNAQYNELKLSKSLTKACICAYLNAFSGAIRANLNVENIFELNNCALPTALCKNGKDSCDANLITSTELLNANQMYKKYFADAVDSLIRLQTKQTALLKDKKYTSLTDFITKNFNGCETPNKNKTIEQKRDSIARVLILAELADKKFITDLNKDISVYQTFNKTYSDQYDKAITDIIAEYVNLSYLTYDYVQKDLPVENTDEFKANVVLANSTKPESKNHYDRSVSEPGLKN